MAGGLILVPLRSRLLIAGAVTLVAAVAWVGVQLLRPVPSMTLTASVTTVRALPGSRPAPIGPAGRRRPSGCR